MPTFEGAVIKEQGVTFAVVVVKQHVLNSQFESQNTARAFAPYFPGMPIILMAQDSHGTPTYYGKSDIADFLASIDISRIPWKRYTFNG